MHTPNVVQTHCDQTECRIVVSLHSPLVTTSDARLLVASTKRIYVSNVHVRAIARVTPLPMFLLLVDVLASFDVLAQAIDVW